MRLFVALEVPEELVVEIGERVAPLKSRLPKARWVRPEAVHLTMVFLGETPEEAAPDLCDALGRACAPTPPLELRLEGAGIFPPGSPARVAWIGFRDDEGLAVLQDRVRRACEETLERELERRPFHPHLTLARPRRPWPRRACGAWAEAFHGAVGEPFTVEEAVLFRSHLEPGGARYEALGRFPLRGRAEEGAAQ